MSVLRRFGVIAFAAAVVAVGSAAPAAAIVPPADGTYTLNQEGAPPTKWVMQSVCIQANGTRAQPDYSDETIQSEGCTLILSSSTGPQLAITNTPYDFSGRALLTGGLWTLQFDAKEAITCPDGSKADSTEKYAFDSATLAGTHTTIHGAVCGDGEAAMTKTPFTLSFDQGLQPPVVDRFPDHCDYLAGRPSICS
jgi:hypothetical protein